MFRLTFGQIIREARTDHVQVDAFIHHRKNLGQIATLRFVITSRQTKLCHISLAGKRKTIMAPKSKPMGKKGKKTPSYIAGNTTPATKKRDWITESATFFGVNLSQQLSFHPLQVWNQTTSLSLRSSLWSVVLGVPWTSETGFDATHPPSPSSPTAPPLELRRPSDSRREDESVHSSDDVCEKAHANLAPNHAFLKNGNVETKFFSIKGKKF